MKTYSACVACFPFAQCRDVNAQYFPIFPLEMLAAQGAQAVSFVGQNIVAGFNTGGSEVPSACN